jgi:hypothetical protein
MTTIIKFPYSASRRVFARKQRSSKNGTPEERATLQEMVAEEIDARPLLLYQRETRADRTRHRRRFGISRRASGASIKPAKTRMKRRRRSIRKRNRQRLAAHTRRLRR